VAVGWVTEGHPACCIISHQQCPNCSHLEDTWAGERAKPGVTRGKISQLNKSRNDSELLRIFLSNFATLQLLNFSAYNIEVNEYKNNTKFQDVFF